MSRKKTVHYEDKQHHWTIVYKIIDNNSRVMEMYMTMPDGKDFKMMESKYTRK